MPARRPPRIRRARGSGQGDRALRRHGDLRRQGHRLPALEVRPARQGLPLPAGGADQGVWDDRATDGATDHPAFGGGGQAIRSVINVIDARQSYLQKIVRAGLEALGHGEQAQASVHFAYEMVALSPPRRVFSASRSRRGSRPEMSGRKGIGVKADDLLDRLEAKAHTEIAERNRDLETPRSARSRTDRDRRAPLLHGQGDDHPRASRSTSTRRSRSRATRARTSSTRSCAPATSAASSPPPAWRARSSAAEVAALPARAAFTDDLWELVHRRGAAGEVVEKAAGSLELSLVARHALELAQQFHALYHHHSVLHEENPDPARCGLATFQLSSRKDCARRPGAPAGCPSRSGCRRRAPRSAQRLQRPRVALGPVAAVSPCRGEDGAARHDRRDHHGDRRVAADLERRLPGRHRVREERERAAGPRSGTSVSTLM